MNFLQKRDSVECMMMLNMPAPPTKQHHIELELIHMQISQQQNTATVLISGVGSIGFQTLTHLWSCMIKGWPI